MPYTLCIFDFLLLTFELSYAVQVSDTTMMTKEQMPATKKFNAYQIIFHI